MAAAMEVDQGAPLAPEVELRLALTQENYKRALELVEHIDLEIHSFSGGAAERGDPAVFAPVQMALYLIARDLNNARHLWRRSPDKLKEPQSMLRALWTVGQHLWQRDVPQAYTALQVQWSPELQPLIKKLKERIQQDELELIQRAFRKIKVATLAERMGMETAAAIAVAKTQGWKVDENEGVVEPVAKPTPPRETLGLSHLDKLTTYVSFLEQKNVTTKG